ncbi:TonB-dependent siderophore receptor [Pseudooceanicola sp. CBS1P-1]|uniref:TonB-dependent siderophore receptor n=1 Tax=Pseudooceanicola albus TaxID=2692189 RepID=A0A6L7G5C7_9RHOB|nr:MULTISPECIES: TonB-dependent siderophore receptor [Pseudooceanicola]MBT9385443.1 TonB-dependent siderophore receptor [Pseudooceanicola endophyticus]MXN18698.1 TonB-dependent siderophore receptor [Pseudooceanicola albus]
MKHGFFLLAGVSTLALISGAALGQEAEGLDLAPITVQGTEDPTGPVAGYAAGTSASIKSTRSLGEVPASVTVVTSDQIDDTGAGNLSEALNYAAGVVTEAYGADPRFDSIVVRGQDLQNQIYLNGLHFSRSTRPDYGAPSLDLYGMERVELLRGPQSTLYGAGSPSGMVNLVQKRAQMSGDTSEMGVELDGNGSWHLFGDFNKVVSDRLAYRIVSRSGNGKTGIPEYDNEGTYLGFALRAEATPSTTVEVLGSFQKDDPDAPAGVPNDFVGLYDGKDLRDFYFGNEANETGDRRTANLGVQITHALDNGWTLNGNVGATKFDWQYSNLSLGSVSGTRVARTLLDQDEAATSLAADLRLSGEVLTGALSHRLTFGADASRFHEAAGSVFYYGQPEIDYADPDYAAFDPVTSGGTYTADKTATVRQLGVYAMDEIEMGRWRASAALRHDWNRARGENVTSYGITDLDRNDSATTGQASLGYGWDNGLSAYLAYATSFSVFAEPDADGNTLKPTEGAQWELGFKYLPPATDIYLTAALYQLDERNRSVAQTVGGTTVYSQVGKSRIRGLELEGRANLADGWSFTGGYSYTDSEIIGGSNDGNQLGLTPEHTAKIWLSKEIQSGPLHSLTLGAGARFIGARYAFNENTQRLDPVTLLDAGITYRSEGGTELRLNVTNLTDEVYVSSVGYFSTYYGDGRTLSASLTRRW